MNARAMGNVAIVRGELDDAYYRALERDPSYRIARRKNDKCDDIPPHLTEVSRYWVMHDIDDYPLPPDAASRRRSSRDYRCGHPQLAARGIP